MNTNKLKVIMKRYKKPDAEWEETTLEDAIAHLSLFWVEDKIESMLMDDGETLWNPFCQYKAVYKEVLE